MIWLTPMYVSPQRDNGYDIADYYQIDPVYGTMEEFELLLKEAHRRGIRIIMDMVLNHTSTEHEWFKKAVSEPDSPYRDTTSSAIRSLTALCPITGSHVQVRLEKGGEERPILPPPV